MLAVVAGFRRGEEPVNLDQGSSIPLGFVFELPDELTPSHIADSFCQAVVLDHVLDCQTLNAYHLVFVHDASRKFVLVVTSTVIDTSMHAGYTDSSLSSILGIFFLSCMPSLCFCQAFFILGIELGIADRLTSGHDHHRFETQVETNHLVYHWQGLDFILNQHGNKVAVRTIFGDGDRTGFTPFGKISMEVDIQRLVHFGKSELTILPLESIRGIGCRLGILPFLEVRIFGPSLKEVLEGSIQVAKGLLKRDRRDFREPRVLMLEIRQQSSKSIVVELLATLFVGSRAGMQSPIVDEADTSERLSQDDPLLISRIEPILVRPLCLAHCLFAFLVFYVSFNCLDRDTSHGANIVGIRPQGRDFLLEIRELLSQLMSSCTLDEFDQPMETELWIATNYQMHMIGHDLHFHKFLLPLLDTFLNERLQSTIDRRNKHLASVLGTEHHMVVTVIGDIFVASNYCLHAQIIAGNSNFVKGKLFIGKRYPSAQAPKKEAPYIPKALGQGFYGAFDKETST